MAWTTEEILDTVAGRIAAFDQAEAAGISGGKAPLPKAGEGDIDVFIYCTEVPSLSQREAVLAGLKGMAEDCRVNVFHGGHWGGGDFLRINGVETWLMYFTVREALAEALDILAGNRPDREDNYFYPVGRLGMLRNMTALFDKSGFLKDLNERLSVYPPELRGKLAGRHLAALRDTEDLARAAARKDALFYHFALDLALDHFLQALFAMNSVYFPSRKRSLKYIRGFQLKPKRCGERIEDVLKLGGSGDTVPKSYAAWQSLTAELTGLYQAENAGQ